MRVRVTYVHRRSFREPLGILALHSSTGQGTHDPRGTLPVCRKFEEEGQDSKEGGDICLDTKESQEPAAKVRRKEDKGEKTQDSLDSGLDSASIGTTRRILKGVLDFFRRKEPTPPLQVTSSLPQLLLPRQFRGMLVATHPPGDQQHKPQREQYQQLHKQQQQELQHQQQQGKERQQQQLQQNQQQQRQQEKQQYLVPATAVELQCEGSTVVPKDFSETAKKTPALRRSRPEDGQKPVRVSHEEFLWFTQLTELPVIESFLKRDICCRYADKYLLAMVFTYFARAGLTREQYTKEYFFAALYLAHDMEEDEEDFKYEVFPWALGPRWRKTYQSLLKVRDDLFFAIHCRAVVSKRGCDQIMEILPGSWLWRRDRPAYHGGAMREYLRHPSDNGRPRGPDKSPLQCMSCLERECEQSDNSYILFLSDSTNSVESHCMESTMIKEHEGRGDSATKHLAGDSGFETFLLEPSGDATNFTSLFDHYHSGLKLEVKH